MSARQTPHPTEDRLIDLAAGLLRPAEASSCLVHLGVCAECEALFRAIAGERARIDAERALPPAPRRWPLVAAASLAALLVLGLLSGPPDPAPPVRPAAYWLPTDREVAVLRSEVDPESSADLARALAAYRGRDAALAASLLHEARVPASHEPLRKLYLASALELAGRPRDSASVLGELDPGLLPEPWRTQARWVGYTVACGTGDTARAEELLDKLQSAPGEIGKLARNERERRAQGR